MTDALAVAKEAVRQFRANGARAGQAPTPERLLRAGGCAVIERFSEAREVVRGGRVETATVEACRVRVCDAPLDRLAMRRQIAPKDFERNELLALAGHRYRELWFTAGLHGLRGTDPGRISMRRCRPEFFGSGRQIDAFEAYCTASNWLTGHERTVVDAVVLDEVEPVEIGRLISGYRQVQQASAIGLFMLRNGLGQLAVHFGLLSNSRGFGGFHGERT